MSIVRIVIVVFVFIFNFSLAFASSLSYRYCNLANCPRENLQSPYLTGPFWSSEFIYEEPVLPRFKNFVERGFKARTWRHFVDVFEIKNLETGEIYKINRDYEVRDDYILLLFEGRMRFVSDDFLSFVDTNYIYKESSRTKDGKPLRTLDDYHKHQIHISYSSDIPLKISLSEAELPNTQARIRNGEDLKLLYFGDSITNGAGGYRRPSFADLSASNISSKTVSNVSWTNISIGGLDSADALKRLHNLDLGAPDLVFIAFGMNDANARVTSSIYENNIRKIITSIEAQSPKSEFILLSGMICNPAWIMCNPSSFEDYQQSLKKISSTKKNVGWVDVTQIWQSFQPDKFLDLTSNGVNHPNEFGQILYAQIINSWFEKNIFLDSKFMLETRPLKSD